MSLTELSIDGDSVEMTSELSKSNSRRSAWVRVYLEQHVRGERPRSDILSYGKLSQSRLQGKALLKNRKDRKNFLKEKKKRREIGKRKRVKNEGKWRQKRNRQWT